jgi:EamA domain-containing membrane protein RarD
MTPTSRGIALKIGATLAFSLQYVALKLAGDVPVGEVVFFRAFFALIPLLVLSLFTIGWRDVVRTRHPWLHLVRAAMCSRKRSGPIAAPRWRWASPASS